MRGETGPVTSPASPSSAPTSSGRASSATSVRAAGPTLVYVPVGVGVGIVALRDHRVLALVVLTIEDGRVVHVEALASDGPRRALSRALGLGPS